MRFRSPNSILKSAAAEDGYPRPALNVLPSLGLQNLLVEEGRPCFTTISKPHTSSSNDSLLRNILAVGTIFIPQLLSWCTQCPQKNDVFIMAESIVNWLTGSGLKESERKDKQEVGAELPVELWQQIGEHLVSRVDIISFRSLCKASRSSMPPPYRFPLLVPRPPNPDRDRYLEALDGVPFFITEHTLYSVDVGSEAMPGIQRVLMQFEMLDQGRNFRRFAYLPEGVDVEPCMTVGLENQLSQHYFVGKAYLLRMALPRFDSHGKRVEGKWGFHSTGLEVQKIVMISSNADGVEASNYVPMSNLSVVAYSRTDCKLALLRLGESEDPNWSWDTSFCSKPFMDIATYKGKLCAVDFWGSAFVMDYKSLRMTQIAAPLSFDPHLRGWKRLVEACGDLYLVVKSEEADVKVYKLHSWFRRWFEVDNIGGNHVFFREISYSISIPRDVLGSSYESLMGKCKGKRRYMEGPSLLFPHDHEDELDDGRDRRAVNYCFLGLTKLICTPQLPTPTASTMTATSSILAQYENSVVGRTNYPELLRSMP